MCSCVCIVCTWRPDVGIGNPPPFFSTLVFGLFVCLCFLTSSLTKPGAPQLCHVSCSVSSRLLPVFTLPGLLLLTHANRSVCIFMLGFYMGTGDLNS